MDYQPTDPGNVNAMLLAFRRRSHVAFSVLLSELYLCESCHSLPGRYLRASLSNHTSAAESCTGCGNFKVFSATATVSAKARFMQVSRSDGDNRFAPFAVT